MEHPPVYNMMSIHFTGHRGLASAVTEHIRDHTNAVLQKHTRPQGPGEQIKAVLTPEQSAHTNS